MDYATLSAEQLAALVRARDDEISQLKAKIERFDAPAMKQTVLKLKTQNQEVLKRERALMQKLTKKEEDIRTLSSELQGFKGKGKTSVDNLSKFLLDPAVNILFEQMRRMIKEKDEKIEKLTSEIEAVQYSTNSLLGKRLLAKCNALINENEELGTLLAESRTEQIERELLLQKKLTDELKKVLSESHDIIVQLDEDVERAQEQIFHLDNKVQQQQARILETEQERDERDRQWERDRQRSRDSRDQDRDAEDEEGMNDSFAERGFERERRGEDEGESEDRRTQQPATPTKVLPSEPDILEKEAASIEGMEPS